jgi:hypothetical protein
MAALSIRADLRLPRVSISPLPNSISLDEFVSLCDAPECLTGRDFFVDSCAGDFSETTAKISTNCTLRFDRSVEFRVKEFVFSNCEVAIDGLFLHGRVSFRCCRATLSGCDIRWVDNGSETLLDGLERSAIVATDCAFLGQKAFGIGIEGQTSLKLTRCEIGRCLLLALESSEESTVECDDCHFFGSDENLVALYDSGVGTFRNCRFEAAGDTGLWADCCKFIVVEGCSFSGCKRGSLRAIKCPSCRIASSQFADTEDSSVIFKQTTCEMTSITVRNAGGNGIWAYHRSNVTIRGAHLEQTVFPSIGVFDRSVAIVENTVISHCQMTGIVIRHGSLASITGSRIEDTQQFGIIASASKGVRLVNTAIARCGYGLVSSLGHAELSLRSCPLSGPTRTALNCYTGGIVDIADSVISDVSDCAIWIHHGGSLRCERVVFATPRDKILKIESQRPIGLTDCVIAGEVPFSLVQNQDRELAKPGRLAVKPRCRVCGGIADRIFSLCGHAQYCRACWDALAQKPQNCPLCSLVVEKVMGLINCGADDDQDLCSICMANRIDGMVGGCGHAMCSTCERLWFDAHTECPYCRAQCSSFRIFVSYE